MPYSSLDDVQFWGQFTSSDFGADAGNYTYKASIQRLIDFADAEIDSYCMVPEGFFNAGGVVIVNEYHDGKFVPSGNKPLLRPHYTPVIVHDNWKYVKLEYLENGSWTTKTEGQSSDYLVVENGVILISLPSRTDYKNVRLTYRAGYLKTPAIINEVSGRLAGGIGRLILNSATPTPISLSGLNVGVPELAHLGQLVFTDELKIKLRRYRFNQIQVYRG